MGDIGLIPRPRRSTAVLISTCLLAIAGCGGGDGKPTATTTSPARACDGRIDGTQTVQGWIHDGAGDEVKVQKELTDEFNASQSKVQVKLAVLPGQPAGTKTYDDLIEAGRRNGTLPSLLEFDGPDMASLAYRGLLLPLDSCIPASLRDDLLPSIRAGGTYRGKLYSVGAQGDSGLGLYARRSILKKAGVRIPSGPADAWTAAEVTAMLPKLRALGYAKPMDFKISIGDEWFTYGFSPAIQSAGGDLVRRPGMDRATGVLNSPASVGVMKTLQSWFKDGYVDTDADERAFMKGRAVISWVGHWQYAEYHDKYGKDLVILPLPRFGPRTVTGMGSWVWGLSTATRDMDAGWAYIAYLMRPESLVKWTNANYLIPATKSAAAASPLFGPKGPLRLYYEQLAGGYAVPRPLTPAYPAITKAFQVAFEDIILKDADVKAALDKAAATIDADVAAHGGYASPSASPSN